MAVKGWRAERRMATELRKLRRKVTELAVEIRRGSLAGRRYHAVPSFPTEPERRLRAIFLDDAATAK